MLFTIGHLIGLVIAAAILIAGAALDEVRP